MGSSQNSLRQGAVASIKNRKLRRLHEKRSNLAVDAEIPGHSQLAGIEVLRLSFSSLFPLSGSLVTQHQSRSHHTRLNGLIHCTLLLYSPEESANMRFYRHKIALLSLYLSVLSLPVLGQQVLEGRVRDALTNEPIYNVNVLVKSLGIGTTTEEDGYFRIVGQIKLPITLVITHIGYEPVEQPIFMFTSLEILMTPIALQLDEVDITVTKLPSQYDVTSSTSSMNSAELAVRGVQDFQEITRSISSVRVEGQHSGVQTISIRGANPNETPVYMDGVKINDTFTNIADLSFLNINDIEELEIIKGAASLPYETGAFGGVVNIYTRVPTKKEASISTALDAVNSENSSQNGTLYLVHDNLAGSYQFSQRDREYFATVTSRNGFHSGSMRWGNQESALSLKYFKQYTETANDFSEGSSVSDDNQLLNLRYTGLVPRLGKDWQADLSYRSDRHGSMFWSVNPNSPTYEQEPHGNQYAFELAKLFEVGAFEGLLKTEQNRQAYLGPSKISIPPSFYRESDIDLDRNTTSYVGIGKYKIISPYTGLQELQVELGMRYDDILTRYDYLEDRFYYSVGSPDPRIVHEEEKYRRHNYFLSKRIGVKSSGKTERSSYAFFYGQGFNSRTPTLQDYFFHKTNDVILYSARNLDHETVNTVDFEFELAFKPPPDYPFSRIDLNLGYFKNAYVSKLNYIYTPAQPPVPYNTVNAMIKGYEIDVQVESLNKLNLFNAGATFLKMDHAEVFAGKPTYRYILGYTFQRSGFRMNGTFWAEGEQYLPDGSIELYNSRENLDITFSYYRSFEHFDLLGTYGIKNLLSREETLEELDRFNTYFALSYYDQFQQVLSLKLTVH